MGFPIRRFTDQSLFAAPHDLSQRTTSFIASQRQGIHQTPLRHLIALIAKARLLTLPIGSERLGAKRPVLLQTHPGIQSGQLHESTTGCPKATWMGARPASQVLANPKGRTSLIRPSTECASSSQCQTSWTRHIRGWTPAARAWRPNASSKAFAEKTLHRTVGDDAARSRRSSRWWWSQTGSNRRPHACKARALPTELWPQSGVGRSGGSVKQVSGYPISDT